jgi:uncharacterized delta-60 repeat protein
MIRLVFNAAMASAGKGVGWRGRVASGLAAACLLLIVLAAPAGAAPADLDRGFGGDGVVPIEGPRGLTFPADASARMTIGPEDEAIVLVSDYACPNEWECPTELTLMRYDAAGNRDPSFGTQLHVQEGPERHPFDLAVGPDGKAVVAAYDSAAGEDGALRVFRFDRAGHLDPTFGGVGETAQPLRPGTSAPVAVAVQPDGKIVVATEGSRVEGGQELRLARYLPEGTLDPGFGSGGVATLVMATQTRPANLLLGGDGSVTVASPYCCVGGTALFGEGFSVARLRADGSPETGFGGSGQLLFPTPGAEGTVASIALAPDGGTFVLFEEGTETVSTVDNLAKLAPNGSLDGAFGSGGRLRTFYRVGSVNPTAIAVDGKGRVVGAGGDDGVAAFRLRPDGSADRTFNGGQRITARFGSTSLAMGLQSSGRVVVLGRGGCCTALGFGLVAFRGGTSRVRCQGRKATIVGTRGRDELTGTKHRDVIAALGGRDKVRGLAGPDLICGGPGRDTLLGGPGTDEIRP